MSTNKKFGKLPARFDARNLKFSKYLTAALPTIPENYAWLPQTEFGMMLNDALGDCTIAGTGHSIQTWTKFNFDYYTPPDADILKAYEAVSGYIDGVTSTDNGANMLDVLNYWRNTGISGHKILAYASLASKDESQFKAAVYLFGLGYIGFNVPAYVEDLFDDNSIAWDIPKAGQDTTIVGGHAIIGVKFTPQYIYFISWGEVYKMTWAFWSMFSDENYAVLSPDFLNKQHNNNPIGFSLTDLQNDLSAIESI